MNDPHEIEALLERAEALHAQAAALADERRPLPLRLLQAHRAKALNDQAQDLLDEVYLRSGLQPYGDAQPERFGRFTRVGWQRMQWFVGIWNALTMVWALADGRWISAAMSGLSMLACTLWILPRKQRKLKR